MSSSTNSRPNQAPLLNKRIVITRAALQNESMIDSIRELGGLPICIPVLEIRPCNEEQLAREIEKHAEYDWIIFTSSNAVIIYFETIKNLSRKVEVPIFTGRYACVGSKTLAALQDLKISNAFVPEKFTGLALSQELPDPSGKKILLPRAAIAGRDLPEKLIERDAIVSEVPCYDTIRKSFDNAARNELEQGVDVVTFASPSAVRNFEQNLRESDSISAEEFFSDTIVACLGPVTRAACEESEIPVKIMADENTTQALIESMVNFFESQAADQ